MGLLDEISDIILVCQGLPRVLEYFIWIVDKMYLDGFLGFLEDLSNDTNENEDYSMKLSTVSETTNAVIFLISLKSMFNSKLWF
jgi:hypothetical protein